MVNSKQKFLASSTVLTLIATSGFAFVNPSLVKASEVNRLQGLGRIETANEVAKSSFNSVDTVILVNGWGYADAVSATPLSKQLNAPILLTANNGRLEWQVKDTIERLGAKKVVLVGGTGVISSNIENDLSYKYEVKRIAGTYDTTRMGTNAAVAREVLRNSRADTAVLVNGQDGYADALSVASIAAAKGYPVLFCNKGEVPRTVKEVVDNNALRVLAVGGGAVVPDYVVRSVDGRRIAEGYDRFDTNLKVLNYFRDDLDLNNIYVAAGGRGGNYGRNDFADALVASAAAAKTGSPVLLTGLGANSTQKDRAKDYVRYNKNDKTNVTIVGGTGSVDYDVEYDIKDIVKPSEDTSKLKISSIEPLNLKQVRINFNKAVTDDKVREDVERESNYTLEDDDDDEVDDIIKEVELDDSGKFAIIIFADKFDGKDYAIENQEKYKLIIDEEVLGEEYTEKIEFRDFQMPRVEAVDVVGIDTIKVKFSEPVMPYNKELLVNGPELNEDSFEINDGDISISQVKLVNDNTEANIILSTDLDDDEDLEVKIKGSIDDYAGMGVVSQRTDLRVNEDTSKPRIVGFKKADRNEVTLIFDKDIRFKNNNDELSLKGDDAKHFYHTNSSNVADEVSIDGRELKLKFDDYKLPNGYAHIYIDSDEIEDLWGNENDKIHYQVHITEDDIRPEVRSIEQDEDRQDVVIVKFSEKMNNEKKEKRRVSNEDNYTVEDENGKKYKIYHVEYDEEDKEAKIHLRKELDDEKKYEITVENIEDLSGNTIRKITKSFRAEDRSKIEWQNVTARLYKPGENTQKIVVDFDKKMLTDGSRFSINDIDNYTLGFARDGKKKMVNVADLYNARVRVEDNGTKAELLLPGNKEDTKDDCYDFSKYKDLKIIVFRVEDANGNRTVGSSNEIEVKRGEEILIGVDKVEAINNEEIEVTFKDKIKFNGNDVSLVYGDSKQLIDNPRFYKRENEDGNTVVRITIPDDEGHGGKDKSRYDEDKPISYEGKYRGEDIYLVIDPKDEYGKKIEVKSENAFGAKIARDEGIKVQDKISPVLIDNLNGKDIGDGHDYEDDAVRYKLGTGIYSGYAVVTLQFRENIDTKSLSTITFDLDEDKEYECIRTIKAYSEGDTVVLVLKGENTKNIKPGFEIDNHNELQDLNENDGEKVSSQISYFKQLDNFPDEAKKIIEKDSFSQGYTVVDNYDELMQAINTSFINKIILASNYDDINKVLNINRLVDIDFGGKTYTGDININSDATGTIKLENGTVNGSVTINTPNADFINNASLTNVVVQNVKNGTFVNNGNIDEVITITDTDGAVFDNSGTLGSGAKINIEPVSDAKATVLLKGAINKLVNIGKSDGYKPMVTIDSTAKVTGEIVVNKETQLTINTNIPEIKVNAEGVQIITGTGVVEPHISGDKAGSAIVNGKSFVKNSPTMLPRDLKFVDENNKENQISGDIIITGSVDELNIESYRVYYLNASGDKIGKEIGTVEKDANPLKITIEPDTNLVEGATQLGVYSVNENGESSNCIEIPLVDKK